MLECGALPAIQTESWSGPSDQTSAETRVANEALVLTSICALRKFAENDVTETTKQLGDHIHARYQDGILEVALEGAAASREPRSIQIEVPPGGQQSVTDVEVGELGTEASAPTIESTRLEEGTQGAAPQGDIPPEAPPEPPPR